MNNIASLLLSALMLPMLASATESRCYGKTSHGRLEHGVRLPASGTNFSSYSRLGIALGRTFLHDKVREVVVDAYAALEKSAPAKLFVYGETGFEQGGKFKPHRTHQNGLSVDFMVPVLDKNGRSVPLPASITNKFGYDIEFDQQGRFEELGIDFEAMGEHLYQLSLHAQRKKLGIALVIFDPVMLPALLKTKRGSYLKKTLPFMKRNAWVRHDDHYHVDFFISCSAMEKK